MLATRKIYKRITDNRNLRKIIMRGVVEASNKEQFSKNQ